MRLNFIILSAGYKTSGGGGRGELECPATIIQSMSDQYREITGLAASSAGLSSIDRTRGDISRQERRTVRGRLELRMQYKLSHF